LNAVKSPVKMSSDELPAGDPRILESPLEAGLELASLTGRRLPGLKLRNRQLLFVGACWSLAIIVMAAFTVAFLWDLVESGEALQSVVVLVYVSLTLLFIPSVGFGLTLILLAVKERQFLPFLEKASGAMSALEGSPPEVQGTESRGAPREGSPLSGILGSAISIGSLVPTAERMATVARGVLAMLLIGLVFLPALVAAGLFLGTFSVRLIAVELAVLAFFAVPAVALFRALSRDLYFYRYYSLRQRAIAEAAAVGPAPVPEGADPLTRLDRHLRSVPPVKAMLASPGGKVEDGPGGHPSTRLYHGRGTGILVRLFDRVPDIAALEGFLAEADLLAKKRGIFLARAVALVAPGGDDIDDSLYDHIIGLGERTRPGECALQLVMEVDGTYSMVPFVGS